MNMARAACWRSGQENDQQRGGDDSNMQERKREAC